MKKHSIDYSLTGVLPELAKAYLDENHATREFYSIPFHLNNIIESAGQRKFKTEDRQLLCNVLASQYRVIQNEITGFEEVKKNIALLAEENTFTVTTGHQLNLFTGPLYFIYKIASTINLASQLNKAKPGLNFVPVYWMASEDHDLEEINHFFIYGKRFQWEQDREGAAGRLTCIGIGSLISQLQSVLGRTEFGNSLIDLLKKAYADGRSLSDATRIIVHEMFGKNGLLILDPDSAELKKSFSNVMIDDATNHHPFKQVSSVISKLQPNYKAQVHPREINLFYLGDGYRSRIEKREAGYAVVDRDKTFTKEKLVEEIKNHPENFSPNVVLRPMYQETVLPNIAALGGPNELAYWLEYKSMFEHYKVSFPCLVLRGMALILDQSIQGRLMKLGFSTEDIFKSPDVLIKEFISRDSQTGFLEDARREVSSAFEKLAERITEIDGTLKASAEAEMQKSLKSIQLLEEKAGKALKRKNETAVLQIEKIKSALFPGGAAQERHENFSSFYAKMGDGFIETLVRELNPLEKKFFVFTEE